MRNNYNVHHTLFTRRQYRSATLPYLLREHNAMKHRIPVADHNELHADIDAIPRMTSDLARLSLAYFHENHQPYDQRIDAFDGLLEYYRHLSRGVGKIAVEGGIFAEHLGEQFPYLLNGERLTL